IRIRRRQTAPRDLRIDFASLVGVIISQPAQVFVREAHHMPQLMERIFACFVLVVKEPLQAEDDLRLPLDFPRLRELVPRDSFRKRQAAAIRRTLWSRSHSKMYSVLTRPTLT